MQVFEYSTVNAATIILYFYLAEQLWIQSVFFTCDTTFAGVSCGQGLNAVWGVRNLISSIFNGDGVGACRVRYIGDSVGAVPVVLDGCILWLALWVLSIDNIELF